MKILLSFVLAGLGAVHCAVAQQAAPLSGTAFQAFDQNVRNRPVLIPKSAGAKAPEPGSIRFEKSARVRVNGNGTEEVAPFVEIPILFVRNSDELLDSVSRQNLQTLAQELKVRGLQGRTFSIAGHASAEGEPRRNEELSTLRAARIQRELRLLGVPASVIVSAEGFGSSHAQHKDPAHASEDQLQKDRRVLVVMEK